MHSRVRIPYASPFDQIGRISLAFFFAVRIGAHLDQWTCLGYRMDMRVENSENLQKNYCQSRKVMLIYNSTREKPEFYIQWRVGETVNSHAFHACIHGFESRTRHHEQNTGDIPCFFLCWKTALFKDELQDPQIDAIGKGERIIPKLLSVGWVR